MNVEDLQQLEPRPIRKAQLLAVEPGEIPLDAAEAEMPNDAEAGEDFHVGGELQVGQDSDLGDD